MVFFGRASILTIEIFNIIIFLLQTRAAGYSSPS
jgi:hypothetical protein